MYVCKKEKGKRNFLLFVWHLKTFSLSKVFHLDIENLTNLDANTIFTKHFSAEWILKPI